MTRFPRPRLTHGLARTAHRALAAITLVLSVPFMSGCSVLPQAEVVDTYVLHAAPAGPATRDAPMTRSIAVMRPLAAPGLDSRRVAVLEQDRRLSSLQGVRWAANAPDLWRDFLVESLRSEPRLPGIVSDEQHVQTDLELHTLLQAFQLESRAEGLQVRLRTDVQLVSRSSRQLVASRRFETTRATVRAPGAMAADFEAMAREQATDMGRWLIQEGRKLP